jgi:hypothetical protein
VNGGGERRRKREEGRKMEWRKERCVRWGSMMRKSKRRRMI